MGRLNDKREGNFAPHIRNKPQFTRVCGRSEVAQHQQQSASSAAPHLFGWQHTGQHRETEEACASQISSPNSNGGITSSAGVTCARQYIYFCMAGTPLANKNTDDSGKTRAVQKKFRPQQLLAAANMG